MKTIKEIETITESIILIIKALLGLTKKALKPKNAKPNTNIQIENISHLLASFFF